MRKLSNRLLEGQIPMNYMSFETEHDNAFEAACATIGKEFNCDVKRLTVYEFETRMAMLRKQQLELEKIRRKH